MNESLERHIRTIPDFPKPGIQFRDITTLFKNGPALRHALALLEAHAAELEIDMVVGIESRGFILGGALASRIGCGFVPARRPGKLPARTVQEHYTLEYGEGVLEVHEDAFRMGQRVLITDDLLATGGTARAAVRLVERLGARVVGLSFIIELDELGGRKQLPGYEVHSLIHY
ncbi:MAG TPA: adenine phosphoribosyltransferase [Candidatus Saccharimonadales bacterium]|nr:adenine phosphoribosyltransferase [Candidatus Saccharimonadales bacterium]